MNLIVGNRYNFVNQKERLIYMGYEYAGGCWHQFAKVSEPEVVWCEVSEQQTTEKYLEETKEEVVQISKSQRKKQKAIAYNIHRSECLAYIEDKKLFPPPPKVLTNADKIARKKAQQILMLGGVMGQMKFDKGY